MLVTEDLNNPAELICIVVFHVPQALNNYP